MSTRRESTLEKSPPSLEDYEFRDPQMSQLIRSYHVEQDGNEFALFYRVGTDSTSHYYLSQTGWGYYAD